MLKPLSFGKYALLLAICLLTFFSLRNPHLMGDYDEYSLSTVAFSSHLSADIRLSDIHTAQKISPRDAHIFQMTADGMRTSSMVPKPGVYRAFTGDVYAIHFAGYSAIAALPFFVFDKIGIAPFSCFFFVNLVFVFILGLCLFRFFGSALMAGAGLALFVVVGGLNYVEWSGPETMSAAGLCAGLLLFSMKSYRLSGLLFGLAIMQNPPIVFALFFAPVMQASIDYQTSVSLKTNISNFVSRNMLIGLVLGFLGFLLPIAFNYWAFGVPSIIAKYAASPHLITASRLFAYYFDLSQGMIIALPAVWLGIFWICLYRTKSTSERLRHLLLALIATAFSLALAIPALSTGNWNSGAVGMMRYVYWGGIPFLFVFLVLLRAYVSRMAGIGKVPLLVFLSCVFLVQASLTYIGHSYFFFEFSPFAKAALKHTPTWYNPVHEMFVAGNERRGGVEIDVNKMFLSNDSSVRKILFHAQNNKIDAQLCGGQRVLALNNSYADAGQGWRYLHGDVRCADALTLSYDLFSDPQLMTFEKGWSSQESGGGIWNGRWSNGPISTISIPQSSNKTVVGVKIIGHYYEENSVTRVFINGEDQGRHSLTGLSAIPLEGIKQTLKIELRHDLPKMPAPTTENGDKRKIAMFLRGIVLYLQ
ncbi:MAG: hypothetical protein Q8Q55_02110 [Undibacterium sp.]|nr:hypothetical protein [Undibacterium sp.]